MSTFSAIDIGRTGVGFSKYWTDVIAHNMANVNTVRAAGEAPFRQRLVVAQALGEQIAPTGSGTAVREVIEDQREAPTAFDPTNPLADEDGYVTHPVVDMAGQMTDLILANRTYQVNLKVIETGREAYQSALRIGTR